MRVVLIIIAAALAILLGLTAFLYRKMFGRRYNASDKPSALHFGDFPTLERRRVTFPSGRNTLTGYFYMGKENTACRALMVFCHGFGHGHTDYLNHIAYWVEKGYRVFAFDNTGFGESSGRDVRGILQPVLDAHAALTYLEKTCPDEKIVLYGHSWGAFACTTVLNFPHRVQGVVALSGFNLSREVLMEKGSEMYGFIVKLMRLTLTIVETVRFGRLRNLTAVDGINKTQAKVLVMHSDDDEMVGKSGIYYHQAEFTNPNVQTVLLHGKGHDLVLTDAALQYAKASNEAYRACKTDRKKLVRYFVEFDKKKRYALDRNTMQKIDDFLNTV